MTHQRLLLHTFVQIEMMEQIYSALFEYTGTHATFDVVLVASFQNDGSNPVRTQQVRAASNRPVRARLQFYLCLDFH